MFRIDDPTATASLPTPETAGTQGYFTEGNPATSTPATNVRASFLNMLQEELISVLTAAGITPGKTTYNQLLTAIKTITLGGTQTWQNMIGSRAASTTYTNTTGKPIAVSATATMSAAGCNAFLNVAGVQVIGAPVNWVGAPASSVFAIVPAGATYSLGATNAATPTAATWVELR